MPTDDTLTDAMPGPMDCDRCIPLLHALLEDELHPEERAHVTTHLAQCPRCRDELLVERALTETLRAGAPSSRRAPRWLLYGAIAAAAVLSAMPFFGLPWQGPIGYVVQRGLTLGLTWQTLSSRELSRNNHVHVPAGITTHLDITDTATIETDGPSVFELDRTDGGWKLTLHEGTLHADVQGDAELIVATRHLQRALTGGRWTLSPHCVDPQDTKKKTKQLATRLQSAIRAVQQGGDLAAAERDLVAVIGHAAATTEQKQRARFYLWCVQGNRGDFARALKTLEHWLKGVGDARQRPYAMYFRGVYESQLGHTAVARRAWQELLREHPDHRFAADAKEALAALGAKEVGVAARQGRIEKWARDAATEIPWAVQVPAALKRARATRQPLLVYVRCVHTLDQLAFPDSIAAPLVGLRDAGYAKDLMFRAGVLSDPRVAARIRENFVPLCLTYHFHSHGKGKGNAVWTRLGTLDESQAAIDPASGAAVPGSLRLSSPGSFLQSMVRPPVDTGDTLRFKARIRTADLATGARALVRVYWSPGGGAQRLLQTPSIAKDSEWTDVRLDIEIDAKPINILVMPTLTGAGTAWFDDMELLHVDDKKPSGNLIVNGSLAPDGPGADPLRALGLRSQDVVTPGLLIVDADKKLLRRLHRIGPVAAEAVLAWLTAEASKNPPDPIPERARRFLNEGNFAAAEAELRAAVKANKGDGEARFLMGLCQHRRGRHADAQTTWRSMAGPTPAGRRAAACLLPTGPHLPLMISVRSSVGMTGDTTEGSTARFDADRALQILLETRLPDGSFGDHNSRMIGGRHHNPWAGAFTAIAVDALTAWLPRLGAERKAAASDARAKAISWLKDWSRRSKATRIDSFNHPYVLQTLLSAGELDTAKIVVARILELQEEDGSFTIYGAHRPTSFNTAQNLMALIGASNKGVSVPAAAIENATAALVQMAQKEKLFPYSTARGHEWMTTPHGSIARDPLCEHALLLAGKGSAQRLREALRRFSKFKKDLRVPTKHYSSDFNPRGHGAYFFFFAQRNAFEAATSLTADDGLRASVIAGVRSEVLAARDADGSFTDHSLYGRGYGTAMALFVLAPRD